MLLILLGSEGRVWGNEHGIKNDQWSSISNGSILWDGNHVKFNISGSLSYGSILSTGGFVEKNGTCTLSWDVENGCRIQVTNVYVSCGSSGNGTLKVGNTSKNCFWSTKEINEKVSLGNDGKVTISASGAKCLMYEIKVTYTITPDAPALASSSKTISVTESLDVADFFGVTNSDFTKSYTCSTQGGNLNGSVFSAEKAGTYYVQSFVTKKDNCHEQSANSQDLVITVNRISGSVTAQDGSTLVNDEFDLNSCITASLGNGNVSYQIVSENSADAEITNETFIAHKAGSYTIQATKAQDDQYNEATTTFTVSVNKKNQTLTFTTDAFDKNIVCGQTEVGVATATASSGLPVTYSSSNDAVASVNEQGDVTGVAISNDDVIITVTQEGNDEYNAATQIERAFHVVAKKEIGFSTEGLSGDYSTIHIDDKPTITVMNEGEGFTYASSQPDVVSIAKSENVLTLAALKMGQSIITLTQPETDTHAKATKTDTITVEKKENTLAVTPVELATLVGNTIQLKLEGQNNTETPIIAQITEQSLASEVHQGEDVISYADGVITALNAGTAKITFSQAESDQYKGYTSSAYEITVRKISNSITVMLNGNATPVVRLKYGATATLAYSSGHIESDFVVNKTSGSYTTLSGNTITAGNEAGNDVYEIVQAETYKYERGNTQFTVRVNNTDEEEGYVYTGWTDGSDKKILFTQTLDLTLSGYPDVMRFKAKQSGVTGCDIYYSTDGNNWVKFDDKDIVYRFAGNGDYADYVSVIPNRDARYIRFDPGAADHHFSEIYVTRKTFVEAASDKTDLGEVYTDETAQATVTVTYSTTNGENIHISSNNPHFAVNKDEIATTKNSEGKQTFTVTYTPDPNNQETEEASILVSDLFYSYEVKLTAKAIKRANTLAVIEDQDLKVDDVITDVYQGKNSDATINYSVSKEGVITFDSETNSLKAIGAGEVTLTLTQAESDTHLGISKSLKVVVSKYDQTISWDRELSAEEVILKVGDHFDGNTAQASSGLELIYSSSNTDVIEVDAKTGALTAKAAGSDVVITATQMGNYKYNQASITRSFTVISKISATVRTSLLAEETNTLVVGETPVTIGCTATLTKENFTIEGNEEGIVETSFADNTLTITPLKKGGPVVIKLTRSEDDSYLSLQQTFRIMVKNPELVLSPTAQQSVKAGEYSKVTLQRTLKAGYNSIALPLNTTIEKLVGESDGDNWVAQLSVVTYNAKDGYSLYFQKVTDGQIVANQPYILHLAKDVENPCFEDAEVVEATSAEHNAQKGSNANFWKMVSNYTPSLPMAGKYGVVNEENCLKKGGASSTLDAFAAYIEFTGGESQKVRTRFVDDEADAIADIQAGKGDTMVYDLQGRRLSKQSNGINIIRQSDGSVRKVLK